MSNPLRKILLAEVLLLIIGGVLTFVLSGGIGAYIFIAAWMLLLLTGIVAFIIYATRRPRRAAGS